MCDVEFYGGKILAGLDGTGQKKFGGTRDGTGSKRFPAGRDGTGESSRVRPGGPSRDNFLLSRQSLVTTEMQSSIRDRVGSKRTNIIKRMRRSSFLSVKILVI